MGPPTDFRNFFGAVIDQGAFNSIPQQSPVANVFLCGHWVFPAGGVSPVMMGGNNAAAMAGEYLSGAD